MVVVIILKWISQVLIVVSGITALLSEAYITDPLTGKRSLTRIGWVAVTTLSMGFLLFVATDIKERRESAEKDILQKQQISSLQEVVKGQNEQIQLSKGIVSSQQEQLTLAKGLNESQKEQIALSEGLTESQRKQLSLSGSLVESQKRQIKLSGSLIEKQGAQIRQLDKISLDRNLSEIEISFKPSPEHWSRISQFYPKQSYYEHTNMKAEKFGDHWRITFDPLLLKGISFGVFFTNKPGHEEFEEVIHTAWPDLSVIWANVFEIRLSDIPGTTPFHISISRNNIAFKFRPPEARLNLGVINDNPSITLKGRNYPQSIRLRSLDSSVILDQTIKLDWKEGQYEYSQYISGPHRLDITFKNLSP